MCRAVIGCVHPQFLISHPEQDANMDLVISSPDERKGVSQSCPMIYQSDFPGFFDTPWTHTIFRVG